MSDYIQVFFGSEIDAISLKSKLNDINIYPVLKNETNNQNDLNQIDWIFENFNNYIDFNIPWNLSLDYKYSILKSK